MGKTMGKGFTLIELLVVISIVSLLSSVVLAALQSARKKADDTQRNQIVGEYVKAITLAYDANNESYPNVGNTTLYCLGNFTDTKCGDLYTFTPTGSVNVNATINGLIGNYITGLPAAKLVNRSSVNPFGFEGPIYKCSIYANSICSQAQIIWRLQQTGQSCIRGATPTSSSDSTLCTLTLN